MEDGPSRLICVCIPLNYRSVCMWDVCTVRLDQHYKEIAFKAYVNDSD